MDIFIFPLQSWWSPWIFQKQLIIEQKYYWKWNPWPWKPISKYQNNYSSWIRSWDTGILIFWQPFWWPSWIFQKVATIEQNLYHNQNPCPWKPMSRHQNHHPSWISSWDISIFIFRRPSWRPSWISWKLATIEQNLNHKQNPWPWKPISRHQNHHPISIIYKVIGVLEFCRPSWRPSWILRNKIFSQIGKLGFQMD